jgi:hypothetical protein
MLPVKRKEPDSMRLSKKNAARQRVLQKAIASGKTLGGLLVGLAATTVTGCGRHSPASTMGRCPDPHYQENATNENAEVLVTEGEIPEQKSPTPNAVQEQQREGVVRGLITPMKQTNCVNEVKEDRQVFGGDI